jgi:Ca2+:H+ antiporter
MGLGAFHGLRGSEDSRADVSLSLAIAMVLLASYLCNLAFQLITHKRLFAGEGGHQASPPRSSPARAVLVLIGATALVAWMSEILVGTIEATTHEWGLGHVFVGVFIVAVLGNAAEHATAVLAAVKNRMDLSLSIAVGSSVQVALFVAPVIVIVSHFVGLEPMDLMFRPGLILAVFFSVLITAQIAGDGESDWLRGVQLLAVYLVLGIIFFFLPG